MGAEADGVVASGVTRIRGVVRGDGSRYDDQFVIMARTDALAVEGLEPTIERARACVEAGADMVFPEAITELGMYRRFAEAVGVPVLANITEFGSTPLFTTEQLASARAQAARLTDSVPDRPQEAEFLAQVTRLSDEVGLQIQDYRPRERRDRVRYRVLTVDLISAGRGTGAAPAAGSSFSTSSAMMSLHRPMHSSQM